VGLKRITWEAAMSQVNAHIEYSFPIPTRASKSAVSQFAEQLATTLQFKPGDVIKGLIARLGGRIEYRNPEIGADGRLPESIIVYGQDEFVIFVPNITSVERDQFTIAHELGHYYLHYPLAYAAHPDKPMRATRWVDENDQDQRRAEWEANWFAAAFLMPENKFRNEFLRCGSSPTVVAAVFGVTGKAAEVRAKSLGLL
jgi:predicted transcriptional regulator